MGNSQHDVDAELGTTRIIEDFFEKQQNSYSAFFDPATRTGAAVLFQLRRDIAADLAVGRGGRMLDLATGTGEITVAVAEAAGVFSAHVNDLSQGMLAVCRRRFEVWERAPATVFSQQDAFALLEESEPGTFDLILSLGLIAHTGRLDRLLNLAARVLSPGGAVLLQSSLTDHLGARITALYARSPLCATRYKVSAYSKADIESAAAGAGLDIAALRRFGVCLPFGDKLPWAVNYQLERAWAAKCGNGGEALFLLQKSA